MSGNLDGKLCVRCKQHLYETMREEPPIERLRNGVPKMFAVLLIGAAIIDYVNETRKEEVLFSICNSYSCFITEYSTMVWMFVIVGICGIIEAFYKIPFVFAASSVLCAVLLFIGFDMQGSNYGQLVMLAVLPILRYTLFSDSYYLAR